MVKLTINGEVKEYDESVTFEGIASDYASEFQSDIAGVIFNGKLKELIHKPGTDGELKFFDMSSFSGHRSYNRTATFLFMKAADDVIGRQNITRLKAEFTIGNGCYISAEGTFTLGEELAKAIQTRMQELVDEKTPIHKSTIKIDTNAFLLSYSVRSIQPNRSPSCEQIISRSCSVSAIEYRC